MVLPLCHHLNERLITNSESKVYNVLFLIHLLHKLKIIFKFAIVDRNADISN